jgi:hypothetical protein
VNNWRRRGVLVKGVDEDENENEEEDKEDGQGRGRERRGATRTTKRLRTDRRR